MKLEDIIKQLRTQIPSFSNRVHGAGEFATIQDNEKSDLAIPSAFVIPLADQASDISGVESNVLEQAVEVRFGVVLVINNSLDRTGLDASNNLLGNQALLFGALLNWSSDPTKYNVIRYSGSRLLRMNRARMYWMFEFKYTYQLCNADGFNPVRDDLGSIYVDWDMYSPSFTGAGQDGNIDAQDEILNLDS